MKLLLSFTLIFAWSIKVGVFYIQLSKNLFGYVSVARHDRLLILGTQVHFSIWACTFLHINNNGILATIFCLVGISRFKKPSSHGQKDTDSLLSLVIHFLAQAILYIDTKTLRKLFTVTFGLFSSSIFVKNIFLHNFFRCFISAL